MTRAFGCKDLDSRVILFLAVLYLRGSCQDVPAGLIEGLASPRFTEREAAHEKLKAWAKAKPAGLTALHRQFLRAEDPEVQVRCRAILKELVLEKEFPGEGYLGISMFEMTVQVPGDKIPRRAIRVGMVLPGSAADRAGLAVNDLVIGLNQLVWREEGMSAEFARKIRQTRPGSEVIVVVFRGEKVSRLKIKVGLKPEDPGAGGVAEAEAARDRFFEKWLNKQAAAGR